MQAKGGSSELRSGWLRKVRGVRSIGSKVVDPRQSEATDPKQSQTRPVWGKRSLSALKEPQHRSKGTTSFAHLGDPGPGSTLNRFYILVRSKAESLKTRSETGWVQTRTHRNGYNSCEGQPVSPARWKRHTEGRSDGAANDASVQHWRRDRGIDPEPPSESKGRRGFSPVWSPASRAGF